MSTMPDLGGLLVLDTDAAVGKTVDHKHKPLIQRAYTDLNGADFWSARSLYLGTDAGGIRARRTLEAMKQRVRTDSARVEEAEWPRA